MYSPADPLTTALVVLAGVGFLFLVALVVSYNRFVRQRNLVRDSWANVDTELRRRYDLIPNLVATVKGYAAHEKQVLENVVAARTAAVADDGSPTHQARTEGRLVGSVRQLLAVAERYPDLRASENFLSLQRELANTEDRIQAARRFFNNNVRDYNIRVQSFPSTLVAGWFNFEEADYFEVEPVVRTAPDVAMP